MLDCKLPTMQGKKIRKQYQDLEDDDITGMSAMIAGQMQSAMQGNTRAFETLIDLADTTDSKATEYNIPAKDIAKSFSDVNRQITDRDYSEYWFKGGRGSVKSSFISLKIVELLKNNPNMCAIVIRRVGATLKDSVYNQMQWAIEQSGLSNDFKFTKSPLEITLKETGQKIYFRGADEPQKIKSIKPPNGMYFGIRWYEEADQMQGMEAMRTIDQSLVRGGEDFIKFVSYNTPKSNLHWINVESNIYKEDRLIHHSTYQDVPLKWLGNQFFNDAEWLKSVNENAYNHEYLGQAVGTGSEVFDNLECREITDEEINYLDYEYHGLDWGWYPDPTVWILVGYDANKSTLYIYDELYAHKMHEKTIADILLNEKCIGTHLVTCDRDMRSIADLKNYGVVARPAEKGNGSVEYSMKWLQRLGKIVIDSKRCPHAWKEFSQYQYELTKDGEPISAYPDRDNHCIDAVRYAMERVWKRRGQ